MYKQAFVRRAFDEAAFLEDGHEFFEKESSGSRIPIKEFNDFELDELFTVYENNEFAEIIILSPMSSM